MTLIVEDGTGLAAADSYASLADTEAYCEARGIVSWTSNTDDDAKEAALRKATDYMSQVYRMRWEGFRRYTTQALDWPRVDVPRRDHSTIDIYDEDVVPDEVKKACMELAVRALSSDLLADLTRETQSESVGEVSVTYVAGGSRQKRFSVVDALLQPLLRAGGGISLVRS